jgi:hypothetical protein
LPDCAAAFEVGLLQASVTLSKVRKRKTNGNTQRSNARLGFHVSRKPVVHVTAEDRLDNGDDTAGLPHVYVPPILFAIARDSHTIFVSWNIDWHSVFEKGTPADRQVHLQVYRADGLEKIVVVEAMAAMHYVTISDPHGPYRVGIGYYQPAGVWHSVAISNEILMPRYEIGETADMAIAMLPFHVSFQHLLDLFEPTSDTALARIIARFQERALSSEEPNRLGPEEKKILRKLNVSPSEIATARRVFDQADCEKLARRATVLPSFGSTSPSRRFESDSASGGS